MAVLLKNLVARSPQGTDWAAVTTLVETCENTERGRGDSSLEDLLAHWQRSDLHLAKDAWVIVTTSGHIVGFACVWCEEQESILTFVCVHPDYRNRGIGTLLLRLVEMWAREQSRLVASDVCVILRGLLSKANQNEQCLFKREGYQAGRQFLHVSFTLVEDTGSSEQSQLLDMPPFYDRDGLCHVHVYETYEKELRSAVSVYIGTENSLEAYTMLVGTD